VHVFLHADNYAGQNKNQLVLAYLAWRIMTGRNDTITYSFMVVGHTKNECDQSFGLMKRKLSREEAVVSASELVDLIPKSAPKKQHLSTVTVRDIAWFDWQGFLSQFFVVLRGISERRTLHFSKLHPSTVVYARKSAESLANCSSERVLCCRKNGLTMTPLVVQKPQEYGLKPCPSMSTGTNT